ncbi:MAG: recombinase family protein [Peptococcaceae bacterium]|nr:recombinase family protein [Peptococcaceae bacterium]
MKVAVYCRVSTDDQADARTIENQVDFARGYCRLHGLDIYDFYLDEGVSGAIPVENRPEGLRLLADARRGCFGAVYV